MSENATHNHSLPHHQAFIDNHLAQYQIKQLIGQGGMSAVYLAQDCQLERQVAIKIIHLDSSGTSVNDGLTEARTLAKLNHPNIVGVYQVFTFENQVALVMEYLNGQTLWQHLKEQVVSFEQKLQWLNQIAQALVAIHKLNIVHCDLKLTNVLLTEDKQIKLVDFGLSQQTKKPCGSHATSSFGSQTIMSPEQLLKQPLDYRSDLFSFGILAFELLAGQHPFGSGNNQVIAERIINTEPLDASKLTPALPPQLSQLLNTLLIKDKNRRPKQSYLVAELLQQILINFSQQDILAQQTAEITTLPDNSNPSINPLLIPVTMAMMVIFALLWFDPFKWQQQPTRTIAIISPNYTATEGMAKIHQDLVRSTIDDAIRQRVLYTPNMNLVAYQQTEHLSQDLNQLAKATGATDIITTNLDCNELRCNVTFSHLAGKHWRVQQRQQWPMVVENFLTIYHESQYQFGLMFTSYGIEPLSTQSTKEQDYLAYVKLYDEVNHQRLVDASTLTQLAEILQSSPYLFAGYGLFREAVRQLYSQQPNKAYTDQLQQMLNQAPPEFRYSVHYALEMYWMYMLIEQYDQAKQQIDIAIERGADLSTQLEIQAYWLRDSNQLEQAIAMYQRAIALRPTTILMYQLAVAYIWSGDIKQAQQTLKQLLAILPNNYDANQLLGSLYMYQGDMKNAIIAYETIIDKQARSIDLSNLAMAYGLIGDYQKSLTLSQQAVSKNPNHATWLLNLADAQAIMGQQDKAQANYHKVIELLAQQKSVKSWLEIAQAYVHTKQADLAIKALNQAKKLAPESGEVAFTAALINTELKEFTSAIAQVDEALNKDIGAVWFNLPWFDPLCRQTKFRQLMQQHSAENRCNK